MLALSCGNYAPDRNQFDEPSFWAGWKECPGQFEEEQELFGQDVDGHFVVRGGNRTPRQFQACSSGLGLPSPDGESGSGLHIIIIAVGLWRGAAGGNGRRDAAGVVVPDRVDAGFRTRV